MLHLQRKKLIRASILMAIIVGLLFAWFSFVAPQFVRFTHPFSYNVAVDSFDNFYSQEVGSYSGEQKSDSTFTLESTRGENGLLLIKNTFDVRTQTGEPIFSTEKIYNVNEVSRKHKTGEYLFGPRLKGLLAQQKDKSSFTYRHINYDEPITLSFRNEEVLYGLPVYRYESNFLADQTKQLTGGLSGVGETLGVNLDVQMSVWIEPYTGALIRYEDQAEAFYYDLETEKRLYPWNKFHNIVDIDSVVRLTERASIEKNKILLLTMIPLGFGILLILLCLWWCLLSRRFKKGRVPTFLTPLGISLVFAVLTVALFFASRSIVNQQIEATFRNEVTKLNDAMLDRFSIYVGALKGAQGFIDSSDTVTRDEWHTYVENLQLQAQYPGMQALGYSVFIEPEDLEGHIEQVRAEGFPDFTVSPEGDRDIYSSILYIEPFDVRNQRAFGFDMYQQPTRKVAMDYARDTGQIGLSGKVILVQEGDTPEQAGFLAYLPVYSDPDVQTRDERREKIVGYVYAAFRMNNFMIGVLSTENSDLSIEIFDGVTGDGSPSDRRIYISDDAVSSVGYEEIREIEVGGHLWELHLRAPKNYGQDFFKSNFPLAILILGLILAVFLFFLLYTLNTRKEEALKIAERITHDLELEKSKDEAILKSIADGVIATDKQGNILFANKAAGNLLKQKTQDMTGKKMIEIVPMQDDKGELISGDRRPATEVLHTNKQVAKTRGYAYMRSDGTSFPISFVVSPIILQGKSIGLIEVFRDVTKEYEIDKAKTEFVSLASHQLRTPLAAIGWYTEMLLAGDAGEISLEQEKYLKEVYKGNKRMVDLVNALLNVSRLDLGTFSVKPEPLSMQELTETVVSEMKAAFSKKAINLSEEYDVLPQIEMDKGLTIIILQNLISNAFKYTPEGGSVTVGLYKKEDSLHISVSDTGYGIPENQQEKVFSKFFRADNVKEHDVEGTGLGLYIVKSIIEKAGGTISFTSKENEGTTFSVVFPLSGMKVREGSRQLT